MAHDNNLTSLLVNRQVPEFVREEYPLFISFLEAYYEYLENKQGSQLNDLTTQSKSLKYASDVDHSIATFESNFFNTYADLLPREVSVSKEFLIKNVLPLYLAKGSEKSFKLLFRMLFNDEVDIILPKNNILRASDGKWIIDNILKVETDIRSVYTGDGSTKTFILAQPVDVTASDITVSIDNVQKTVNVDFYIRKETQKLIFHTAPTNGSTISVVYDNFDITLLNNRKVTGVSSGATALIERATKRIITDQLNLGFPFQLFINSKTLIGSFDQGEEIITDIISSNGTIITLKADTFSIVNQINVINGGASYNVGDPVILTGGGASVSGAGLVDDIVEGYIDGIVVNYGGAGFQNGSDITVSGIAPLILDLAVDGVDATGVANSTQNTYFVNSDVINDYLTVNISNSDYGFPSTVVPTGENVSTVIADALTEFEMTNLGPITNVIVLFSNTEVSVSPSLDAYGATYIAGNSTFNIRTIESVGRIKINNGGENYNVGDEIVFTNPSGTFGQGAAAAVKQVDANGTITQIEIQPSRVTGTVNLINNTAEIVGTGTNFGTDIRVGDKIIAMNQTRYINTVSNTTHATVNVNFEFADLLIYANNKHLGRYGVYPIGGQRYDANNLPTLTINTDAGTSANIEVSALMSDNESITPFIGNVQPGQIITIKVVDGGSGYQYIPQVDLTGYGDGTATANAEIEAVYSTFSGRWTTSDSILSTPERRLQGENYYVDYSYITSSLTEFTKYKNILRDLLHPSGYVQYADLNKKSTIVPTTITYNTATESTLSGTVNVENTSIYVTGTNTYFNVANTNGIISTGSNIAINGIIRTIDSIISNTNLSVTSAFTSTSNAQTVIILA